MVARERSRLVLLKTIPTGNLTPLANAAMVIAPVISIDDFRPVSTTPGIVLFYFFGNSLTDISFNKKMTQFREICLIDMFAILVVP